MMYSDSLVRTMSPLLLTLCISPFAWAARTKPPNVAPVVHAGIKYTAPNDNGTRGYVKFWDAKTGRFLGATTVFTVSIKPELETDVQWVFIKHLEIKEGKLLVTDERGRRHTIELKPMAIEEPARPMKKRTARQQLQDLRTISAACIQFAADGDGKLPQKTEDLRGYLPKGFDLNWVSLVKQDKAMFEIENHGKTPLVRANDRLPGNKRAVAFADGHCELVLESDDVKGDKESD